jgi:hypothetical protein
MAKSKQSLSETEIAIRIKQGRGKGHGKSYKPWLNVQDVPSDGRSHRIYSHKTGRVHHLLSDLELAAFLTFEWESQTIDIREQFPLRLEESRELARQLEIKHPNVRGVDQIISTDFLVDVKNETVHQFAVQVKSSFVYDDRRTLEKLELERRYWEKKGIPWISFSEDLINPIMKQNIEWLFPMKSEELNKNDLSLQISLFYKIIMEFPDMNVIDICKYIDSSYDLEFGQSLRELRALISKGLIKFNIYKKFRECISSELVFCNMAEVGDDLYVVN